MMAIQLIKKFDNITAATPIGRCRKNRITPLINDLPEGPQKEKILQLWQTYLANQGNEKQFNCLKITVQSLRREDSSDVFLKIFSYAGVPQAATVCKRWHDDMALSYRDTLRDYRADPKIAPLVPMMEETPIELVKKTYANVQAIAKPISAELPAHLQKLSPLDLRPVIDAVEDVNLIRFFTKILRKIPASLRPNFKMLSQRTQAIAMRGWMHANQETLRAITKLDLSRVNLTIIPHEYRYLRNLRTFEFSQNQCANLRYFGLHGNPLICPPTKIEEPIQLAFSDNAYLAWGCCCLAFLTAIAGTSAWKAIQYISREE